MKFKYKHSHGICHVLGGGGVIEIPDSIKEKEEYKRGFSVIFDVDDAVAILGEDMFAYIGALGYVYGYDRPNAHDKGFELVMLSSLDTLHIRFYDDGYRVTGEYIGSIA